jgi:hypothetical protein
VAKDLTMSFWLQHRMKKLTKVGIDKKGGENASFFYRRARSALSKSKGAPINPQGSGKANVEIF